MAKIVLTFTLFSLCAFGNDFNLPRKSELGKLGSYIYETTKLPQRYRNIWGLSTFAPKNHNTKYGSGTTSARNHFKWTVYAPKTYEKEKKSGLAIIATSFEFDEFPEAWKQLAELKNIILIAPKLTGYRTYPLHLNFAAYEFIQTRYNLDSSFVTYVSFSPNLDHHFVLHSSDKLTGVISLNSKISWDERKLSSGEQSGSFYNSMILNAKKLPISVYACDRGGNTVNSEFLENELKFLSKYEFKNIIKVKAELKAYVNMHEILSTSQGSKIDYITPVLKFIFNKISVGKLEELFSYKDKIITAKKELLFKQAKSFEKEMKLANALALYKTINDRFKDERAAKKIFALMKNLEAKIAEVKRLFNSKDFYPSYVLCKNLTAQYGKVFTRDLEKFIKRFEEDKTISKELKAAKHLESIEDAITVGSTSKANAVKALKEVIDYCPGSKTAEKAQAILDKLK